MIENRDVVAAECDGCGRTRYTEDALVLLGYEGTVTHHIHDGLQGVTATWFACGTRCVSNAVQGALKRERLHIPGLDDEPQA